MSIIDGIDIATQPCEPTNVNITTELLELFERSLAEGKAHQAKAIEDDQPKNIAL